MNGRLFLSKLPDINGWLGSCDHRQLDCSSGEMVELYWDAYNKGLGYRWDSDGMPEWMSQQLEVDGQEGKED